MKFAELDEVEKKLWEFTIEYCNKQTELLFLSKPKRKVYPDIDNDSELYYFSIDRQAKNLYQEMLTLKAILSHDNKKDICQN